MPIPIGNVDRLPADAIPSRAHADPLAWCVRAGLLLLASPALVLVLIVGGLLVLAQAAARGLGRFAGLLRGGRPPGSPGLAGPEGSPAPRLMASGVEASRARRGRPA